MPLPAVIHCTSPAVIFPLLPKSCHRARPSRPGRILGVFWRNWRPDDVAALLDSVNSNDHVAPDHLNRRELLAELAFGDFNLAPLRARELAEAAREQIEQETWTPHRGRLLGHALTGLSTSKTRELSAQQSSALGLRDRLASGMGFRNWQLARERTHVVGAATGAQRRGGERAAGRGPSYRTSL
jgi:hypothetical protein